MKKRLTTYIFLIAALGIALSSVFGVWAYRNRELTAARQTLVELLNLMDAQSYYTDAAAWSAQFAVAAPDKRLTIIAPDGSVLSDTWGEVTASHADRPEFQDALAKGSGEAIRPSDTTRTTMLYEARRFTDGNIGRVSMPISSVNALVLQGVAGFLAAAAVALVLTLLLARKLADSTAQPLELKQEELDQEGEKLQTVRSEFAANVSHELKTPLASIRLLTDSILQTGDMDPATVKDFVSDIGEEAERLTRISEKLLTLTRMDSAVAVAEVPVDVKRVVEKVEHMLTPLADEGEVTVETDLQEDCMVLATEDDLYQIAFNLMENAVKYNLPGGSVTVTLRGAGDLVTLTVEDTGVGIPEEDLGKVFDRVYRAAGGTGLGLSIVRDTVRQHGGAVTVRRRESEGTCFEVAFPRWYGEEKGGAL